MTNEKLRRQATWSTLDGGSQETDWNRTADGGAASATGAAQEGRGGEGGKVGGEENPSCIPATRCKRKQGEGGIVGEYSK